MVGLEVTAVCPKATSGRESARFRLIICSLRPDQGTEPGLVSNAPLQGFQSGRMG